jgi:DNA helicase-2/ATP-dependent DNA helicase PcrA
VRAFRRTLFGNQQVNTPSRFLLDVPQSLAMVTHAPGAGRTAAWSSPREDRPPMTRQQAREYAARAFTPQTPEPRTGPRPARPPRTGEPTYRSGDKVSHPTFGTGIVVGVRADPSAEIIEVNFAGTAGIKKLDVAFAPLTKV